MGYFLLGSSGFAHSLFAAGERDARTSNSSMKMRKAMRRLERMLPIAGRPPLGSKPYLCPRSLPVFLLIKCHEPQPAQSTC